VSKLTETQEALLGLIHNCAFGTLPGNFTRAVHGYSLVALRNRGMIEMVDGGYKLTPAGREALRKEQTP
jgi:hypothetical protein